MKRICMVWCLIGMIVGVAACGRMERGMNGKVREAYGKEAESIREERQENEIMGKEDSGEIEFECKSIEAAVREQLELEQGVVICEQALEEIEALYIVFKDEDEPAGITGDLRYFTNLKSLNIYVDSECREEKVLDYGELGAGGTLNQLKELYIRDCYLEDISFVTRLDLLEGLYIPTANVKDISVLREMKQLTRLSLYDTPVLDVEPVSELTNLVELSLANCGRIKNIEVIASLTKMENLGLMYCGIGDISFLKDMKNLRYLNLTGNQIEDISLLAQFTQMSGLSLDGNEIKDVSVLAGMENLAVASVYDNPIENLGVLAGVVPSFDASAARTDENAAWKNEAEKALQIYDVTAVEVEGHFLEVEDYYVGDATGDGIDDVGIVASWINEDLYDTKEYRMLYVYPGTGSSYEKPLEPMEMRDGASGGVQGDPYNGIILQDGKLLIQYQGGSNFSWRITSVYKIKNQTWECMMETQLDWWSGSTGYDYRIEDYENNLVSRYILCVDDWYLWNKLKISEEKIDAKSTDKIPDAWDSYYRYLYHHEMAQLPYSAQDALEMVVNEYYGEYEKEKVYITNEEGLLSCEKIFGYDLPDYYYTMNTQDGFVEVFYYNRITDGNAEEALKHGIKVCLNGKPYELYTVDIQNGKMELADTYEVSDED